MIGATAFLVAQMRNILPRGELARLTARFTELQNAGYDAGAIYAWPARAVLGDPLPLLALTVVCGGAFALATHTVGKRFGSDAAAAAGISINGVAQTRRRTAGADRLRFAGGPLRTLARKDWRLLIRDPWLLSQLLLQMVWFVPLAS